MEKKSDNTPDMQDLQEPKVELLFELNKIMIEKRIYPQKLFIVGSDKFLLVYQGMVSHGMNRGDFGVVVPTNLDRGKILDSFSKFELIINEIIEAKILEETSENAPELSDLTDRISLSQKIHLLKKWNLICQETFDILHRLRNVRNVIAHSWHIKNAIYETDQTLETNFNKFKEDLRLAWHRLVNVYDFLRPQNQQLEKVLQQLKKVLASD